MRKIVGIIVLMFIGTIAVSAEYLAPDAVDDVVTTNEGVSINIDVLANDINNGSGSLVVSFISDITNGSGLITSGGTGVIFTPTGDFNGTGSFDYVVSDGTLTDTGHVIVIVNPVNDTPIAVDNSFTVVKNTTTLLNLVSNDTDVDSNNLVISSLGTILNGSGVITAGGTGVMFTPSMNFVGVIGFDYVVSDGNLTDTGHVSVTVVAENRIPVAIDDNITLNMNTQKTFDPRVNDTDADGNTLAITGKTDGANGLVTFSSTSLTYKPNTGFYGQDSFTYTISDGKGGTDVGLVRASVLRNDNGGHDYVDEDEDEDEDYDDNDHSVQETQKEFIKKFKELKNEYKHRMSSNEYKNAKNELRDEYFKKLKEVTGKGKKDTSNSQQTSTNTNYNYQSNSIKEMYKTQFEVKYGSRLNAMTDAQLNIVIGKIDNLLVTINASNTYTQLVKTKLNTMLQALKEIVLENMSINGDIIDIDSLLQ
ncbi:MAG: Ig-like domain-containing protein [Candidatus Gracilibacteria bacterium]|nr:Ig-like domain-containing protein [Candidatus Gracilibacteria bacterium]